LKLYFQRIKDSIVPYFEFLKRIFEKKSFCSKSLFLKEEGESYQLEKAPFLR